MSKMIAILGLLSIVSSGYAAELGTSNSSARGKEVVCVSSINYDSFTSMIELSKNSESLLKDDGEYSLNVSLNEEDSEKIQIRLYKLSSHWGLKRAKTFVAQAIGNELRVKLGEEFFQATCKGKEIYKTEILKTICDENGNAKYTYPAAIFRCDNLKRIGLFK